MHFAGRQAGTQANRLQLLTGVCYLLLDDLCLRAVENRYLVMSNGIILMA